MHTPSLTDAVRRELLVRSELTESTHRFAGIEFRLGRRELGHLHGDELAVAARSRGSRHEVALATSSSERQSLR